MKKTSFIAQKVKRTIYFDVSKSVSVLSSGTASGPCSNSTASIASFAMRPRSCGSARYRPCSALRTCACSDSLDPAKSAPGTRCSSAETLALRKLVDMLLCIYP